MNGDNIICGENDVNLTIPKEKIDLYYFTDPICSHCWALEPVMSRFQMQYGDYLNVHTIMGGLLKNWEVYEDVSKDIYVPSDVHVYWSEVRQHFRMPIDGSLWLDNPIQSSYPASRVFKVIQQMNENLATKFLRKAREAIFVFNQNIGEDQVLIEIVSELGISGNDIVKEANLSKSQRLLDQDFDFARKLGVRGHPTVIMANKENKALKIIGTHSFDSYIDGLKKILNDKEELQTVSMPALPQLFENRTRLFYREIEEIYGLKQNEVSSFIQENLPPSDYVLKEAVGEIYIEKCKHQAWIKYSYGCVR